MTLKERVEKILKDKKSSLTWLSAEMGMSIDGFRISLKRESIKYADLVKMCDKLGVTADVLFVEGTNEQNEVRTAVMKEAALKPADEMIEVLMGQLRDKERIIELISKSK